MIKKTLTIAQQNNDRFKITTNCIQAAVQTQPNAKDRNNNAKHTFECALNFMRTAQGTVCQETLTFCWETVASGRGERIFWAGCNGIDQWEAWSLRSLKVTDSYRGLRCSLPPLIGLKMLPKTNCLNSLPDLLYLFLYATVHLHFLFVSIFKRVLDTLCDKKSLYQLDVLVILLF